jgi:acetate CoA/acetoacetate CoA-transferase beta subunit
MEVTPEGLVLKEIAEGLTVEEVVKATEAELIIPNKVGTF